MKKRTGPLAARAAAHVVHEDEVVGRLACGPGARLCPRRARAIRLVDGDVVEIERAAEVEGKLFVEGRERAFWVLGLVSMPMPIPMLSAEVHTRGSGACVTHQLNAVPVTVQEVQGEKQMATNAHCGRGTITAGAQHRQS